MRDPAGRGIPRAARAAALLAALAALLVAAPAAQAAFGISGFSAQPASKAAGANSDLSVSFDVAEPAAGLKDITVHLPPGLIGNPLATPTCSEAKLKADDCPARSDVGDARNEVTVKPLGLLPIPLTVNGQVYNVEPRKGEPARFGIVLDPSPVPGLGGGTLPKIVLQQTARLRQSDFGLDTELRNIPRSAKIGGASTPLEVRSVELTLEGKVNGGKGFLRNPTSCGMKTIAIDADAYNGAMASAQDQFTTTDCAALPFSPKFSARIHQLSRDLGDPVQLTTSISQTIEEAGLRRAVVTLPTDIQGNADALGIRCPEATFDAGTCPADTKVGTATAASPLQPRPLSGAVYLVEGTGFPQLGIDLEGGLALKVKGVISLVAVPGGAVQIVVTFDGLPDIPLSDFSLTFSGGEDGLNRTARNPCQPPPFVFNAAFLGHSGATRNVDVDADASCPGSGGGGKGKAKARVEVAKLGSGKPRLRIRLRHRGAKIRRAEVKLPRGLKVGPKRKLRKRGHVSGGGSLRGHRRLLHVRGGDGGSAKVRVRLGRGAVKAKRGLRAKDLGRFAIKVRTTAGETTRLSVRAR